MFLLQTVDSFVLNIALFAVLASVVGVFFSKIKQPYIIGYILIGAFAGHYGLGIVDQPDLIHASGEIGIVLLLFFIGMEVDLKDLVSKWRLSLMGTIIQVLISVFVIYAIGQFFNWSFERALVIGFVISLSSTAVSIRLLEDKGLLRTQVGKNVLSVLLAQDIIIVPLLLITSFIGGAKTDNSEYLMMIIGGVVVLAVLLLLLFKKNIHLPFAKRIMREKELQVFAAILFCFGGALLTSFFNLSAALGAFIGGMAINRARETGWIQNTLHSFRVLFVALFFISIGLQLNFDFLLNNAWMLLGAVAAVFLLNQLINTSILKVFGSPRDEALLGGAYLAQIGELSFLIAATAFSLGIKSQFAYNFTISLISLTLVISPFWIALIERFAKRIKEVK